jgi:hypothetical protein
MLRDVAMCTDDERNATQQKLSPAPGLVYNSKIHSFSSDLACSITCLLPITIRRSPFIAM